MKQRKKWLFDKGKTSGSKKRWAYGGDFANERNSKQFRELEDAPKKVGMKTGKVFNNRLSFAPLRRFLGAKVGKNWDDIYSEMKERIPKDIWEYHNPDTYYVSIKVEIQSDGSIETTQTFGGNRIVLSEDGIKAKYGRYSTYYVHPETNLLCRLEPNSYGKEKLSKKEGKKKFAEFKTEKKKSKVSWKKDKKSFSDKAEKVMQEKKNKKDDIQED